MYSNQIKWNIKIWWSLNDYTSNFIMFYLLIYLIISASLSVLYTGPDLPIGTAGLGKGIYWYRKCIYNTTELYMVIHKLFGYFFLNCSPLLLQMWNKGSCNIGKIFPVPTLVQYLCLRLQTILRFLIISLLYNTKRPRTYKYLLNSYFNCKSLWNIATLGIAWFRKHIFR